MKKLVSLVLALMMVLSMSAAMAKDKVRLDGTDAYADMSVIAQDCKDRPFFLFSPKG